MIPGAEQTISSINESLGIAVARLDGSIVGRSIEPVVEEPPETDDKL